MLVFRHLCVLYDSPTLSHLFATFLSPGIYLSKFATSMPAGCTEYIFFSHMLNAFCHPPNHTDFCLWVLRKIFLNFFFTDDFFWLPWLMLLSSMSNEEVWLSRSWPLLGSPRWSALEDWLWGKLSCVPCDKLSSESEKFKDLECKKAADTPFVAGWGEHTSTCLSPVTAPPMYTPPYSAEEPVLVLGAGWEGEAFVTPGRLEIVWGVWWWWPVYDVAAIRSGACCSLNEDRKGTCWVR